MVIIDIHSLYSNSFFQPMSKRNSKMKMISLAVASIVDANLNQGYTRQFTQYKSGQIDAHIGRGRQIRAKSIFDLAGSIVGKLVQLVDRIKANALERRAIEQLLCLNTHLQNDIGLSEFDLQRLKSGHLSLEDIGHRRSQMYTATQQARQKQTLRVRKSILDLESANQDCFELAKCS